MRKSKTFPPGGGAPVDDVGRKAVVIVAYVADPTHATASVPLIGYKIASGVAALTDATLIAHRRDREGLVGAFPGKVRFAGSTTFSSLCRRIARRLFPTRWNLISVLELADYVLFDVHAFLILRRMAKRSFIDYVLRINPVSFRIPSLLPYAPVPVFTGPHNGGMEWPAGFAFLEQQERTGSRLRVLGDILHQLYGDVGRYAGIFVAHEMCARTIPRAHRDKAVLVSENGVDSVHAPSRFAGDATRLLYVGRLTPFKAVDVLLRALARLPESVTLQIVGDGPQRPELEELAQRLKVEHRCHFHGEQPYASLERYYGEAGVFVFPSVRESGGAVVLEAMSYGLPCLVAGWGGPEIFTAKTGIHLSVDSPRALEDDIVRSVTRLLNGPALGRELSEAARSEVNGEYVWDSKAALLHAVMSARIASDHHRTVGD